MCRCTPSKPGPRFCGVGRCALGKWDYSRPFADVPREAAPPPPPRKPKRPKPEAGMREGDAARIARNRARREKDRAYQAEKRQAVPKEPPPPPGRITELQAKPLLTRQEKVELSHLLMQKFEGRTEKLRVPY